LATSSHTFQRGQSKELDAVYHLTFTGKEPKTATVFIQAQSIRVVDGHQGTANLHLTADSETWLGFLAKERSLLWAFLRFKPIIFVMPESGRIDLPFPYSLLEANR
jgi:hypothetical protein